MVERASAQQSTSTWVSTVGVSAGGDTHGAGAKAQRRSVTIASTPPGSKRRRPEVAESETGEAGWRTPRAARPVFERRAGRLLRLLKDSSGYRALGFGRLAEYVAERLGLGNRTAQEMMRVDAALESLPLMAAAAEAGEIGSGHLRLLTRVARPDTEAFWLSVARGMTVRELARALSAAAEDEVADGPRSHDGIGSNPGSRRDGASNDSARRAGRGSEILGAHDIGGSTDLDAHLAEPAQERLSIVGPAWVMTLWRDTLPIVRRLVGSELAPGPCLEMVLAELASDVGSDIPTMPGIPADHALNRQDGVNAEMALTDPLVSSPSPTDDPGRGAGQGSQSRASVPAPQFIPPVQADVDPQHLLGTHQ